MSVIVLNQEPHKKTTQSNWSDWKWQQKNAIQNTQALLNTCDISDEKISFQIEKNLAGRKMKITPYYMKLILDSNRSDDITQNPLWRQVVPFWQEEIEGKNAYDGTTENWELDHEMKTPICQHKYNNRVILRMVNTCNSYCQFCFEALRTLNVDNGKANANRAYFEASLEYIRNTPSIEEVILSGGDPLMLADQKLEEYLAAIRAVREDILIRLHTRVLTFNPYRITDKLIEIMKKYKINAFGVHVCHPDELSPDFAAAIKRVQTVVPITFSNMPLLKSINDNAETLHKLFIQLYRLGVKPYYLYHFMPFSPGAAVYKASIKDAIALMNQLKRRVSNIAMPEYVLPHAKGKFTVPLYKNDNNPPKFEIIDGIRYYRFQNWQGEWCDWNDD